MSKITLNNVGSISQNPTTAASTINANNAVIQTAFDNTLSLNGAIPNQMGSNLDMNNNRIINLPTGVGNTEPITVATFNAAVLGKGNVPVGGTANQILAKNSSLDYDIKWINESSDLTAGSNIVITGTSPATIATTATPTFTSISGLSSLNVSGLTASSAVATDGSKNLVSVTNTGTGSNVLATSPTLVTPALGTPTSGVLTNCTGTAAGLTAGNVTTNANLTGPITSVGNATSVAAQTGTGTTFVMNTSPTLVTPTIGAASGTSLNLSGLTASSAVATDASKNLVSVTNTGSGNNVLATSPTFSTSVIVNGTTSGTTTVQASATASGTLTLPAATDTLVGKATTDTLTNKTLTSPTMTTPVLGTPTSGTLTNCTGYTVANLSDGAWSTYTPTVLSQSGTFTTVSATGRYKQIGKTVHAEASVTITSAGTAAGYLSVSLPLTAASNSYAGIAYEAALTGKSGGAAVTSAGGFGVAICRYSDASTMIATGNNPVISITYEVP